MCRTRIDLYSGFDGVYPTPKLATRAGLRHRLAVVQATYRPDSADMYFDAPLWHRLVAFATTFAPGVRVTVVDRPLGAQRREPSTSDETPIEVFMGAQRGRVEEDPAEYLMVRDEGGSLVCCVVTEFWTAVGGPAPYADSLTYAIYTQGDASQRVRRHLADAEAAHGWDLSAIVHELTAGGRS